MSAATSGAATGMPGLPEMWQWQEQLVGFGTRYTGSSDHAAYADWLAGQLSAVPGFCMAGPRLCPDGQRPPSAGRSGPVPLTYYYPYSGQTPPGGVTGAWSIWAFPGRQRLHRGVLGTGPGGMALVRAVPPEFSLDLAQAVARLRAGPDLRPGSHRLRGVRCGADQSPLAGHSRAGSAARREGHRRARRAGRLDGAA
jgi:hypothetical protein